MTVTFDTMTLYGVKLDTPEGREFLYQSFRVKVVLALSGQHRQGKAELVIDREDFLAMPGVFQPVLWLDGAALPYEPDAVLGAVVPIFWERWLDRLVPELTADGWLATCRIDGRYRLLCCYWGRMVPVMRVRYPDWFADRTAA